MTQQQPEAQRARALELLKKLAWNATSFQVLEPDFCYWFHPHGFVAYVDTGSAWVAAGAPFGTDQDLLELTSGFVAEARQKRRRAVFFGVEERFARETGFDTIDAGLQPWWNPQQWPEVLRRHKRLREQLRRARAKGVTVQRVAPEDLDERLRGEIEAVTRRWLQSRPMPPMAFLVDVHPFTFAVERRYYVARRNERCIGYLASVPIYRRNGWFFEDLIREPGAPNGTSEALINAAMDDVAADGCKFATLGLAPLAGDKEWMRRLRRISSGLYNFEGVHAFKGRLHPDGWDPIYIARPPRRSAILAVYDVLSAFAHGKPVRFGIATFFRPSKFILKLMTAAIGVWTVLMALAPTQRWFASSSIHTGWVLFDLLLLACFARLSFAKSRSLLAITCGMLSIDTVLTAVQFLTFNVARLSSPADWIVAGLSLLGPPLALVILSRGFD